MSSARGAELLPKAEVWAWGVEPEPDQQARQELCLLWAGQMESEGKAEKASVLKQVRGRCKG